MTKTDFLEALENKLTGEVDANTVRRNLRYYDGYIESAVRDGKSEDEVLEELGSPLLIAKTIIDTSEEADYGSAYESMEEPERPESYRAFHIETGDAKTKVILLLALIVILFLLFTVLRILLPICLPVLLVILVINLFKKR